MGAGGTVLRSRDAGESWEVRLSGTVRYLWGVAALSDGRTLIAVGVVGTVLRSLDAGESWEARPSGTEQDLGGVTPLAAGRRVVAVGAGGDGAAQRGWGLNWALQRSHADVLLFAVVALRDHIIAVGEGGMVSPLTTSVRASAADEFRFTVESETLTVAWRYPPGQSCCSDKSIVPH